MDTCGLKWEDMAQEWEGGTLALKWVRAAPEECENEVEAE